MGSTFRRCLYYKVLGRSLKFAISMVGQQSAMRSCLWQAAKPSAQDFAMSDFSLIFDSMLSPIIDQALGQRCRSIIGYQYSEIVRSLMSVYFCGGSCVENITSHLMRHLSCHPMLRTCSSDTILRAIKELTQENISYTSDQGKTYDFNESSGTGSSTQIIGDRFIDPKE